MKRKDTSNKKKEKRYSYGFYDNSATATASTTKNWREEYDIWKRAVQLRAQVLGIDII